MLEIRLLGIISTRMHFRIKKVNIIANDYLNHCYTWTKVKELAEEYTPLVNCENLQQCANYLVWEKIRCHPDGFLMQSTTYNNSRKTPSANIFHTGPNHSNMEVEVLLTQYGLTEKATYTRETVGKFINAITNILFPTFAWGIITFPPLNINALRNLLLSSTNAPWWMNTWMVQFLLP